MHDELVVKDPLIAEMHRDESDMFGKVLTLLNPNKALDNSKAIIDVIGNFSTVGTSKMEQEKISEEAYKKISNILNSDTDILPNAREFGQEDDISDNKYPGFDAMTPKEKECFLTGYNRGIRDGKLERESVTGWQPITIDKNGTMENIPKHNQKVLFKYNAGFFLNDIRERSHP